MENKQNTPIYKGNFRRGKEIIDILEKHGGVNQLFFNGCNKDCLYFINDDNNIDIVDDVSVQALIKQNLTVFELPCVPLIEGEIYSNVIYDTTQCIFIYKKAKDINSSSLCGIDKHGNFVLELGDFGDLEDIVLASEYQKKFLLNKISEEGYEFNTKELSITKSKCKPFTLLEGDTFLYKDIDFLWKLDVCKRSEMNNLVSGYNGKHPVKCVIPFKGNEEIINTVNDPEYSYTLVK